MIDHMISDRWIVSQDVKQGTHILPGGEELQVSLDKKNIPKFNMAPLEMLLKKKPKTANIIRDDIWPLK